MFDLKGKTALVTGATGGIGREITERFLEAGANVVATGRNKKKLIELFGNKANVACITCDLADHTKIESVFDDANSKFDGIDILVSNAGITKDNLALRMSFEDFEEVMLVNTGATFLLNKFAIKAMMKKRWGRIINISSIVAFTGNPGQVNYTASKAAIVAMSKSFAKEVASRNITVNVIAPGFIQTPMTDSLNETLKESLIKNIPIGSIGEARDIASGAVYLASNEAKYITGHTLHINGGMYMS